MGEIARTPVNDADALLARSKKANDAVTDATRSLNQLRTEFSSVSVGRVDDNVINLLKEPIDLVRPFIPSKGVIDRGPFESTLVMLCRRLGPILGKYPFNPTSTNDLSLREFSDWFKPDGLIWKEQQASFANLVISDGKNWKQNPAAPGVSASPSFLDFLKRAQEITNVFFADGGNAGITYTLRPFLANTTQVIEFRIDGVTVVWDQNRRLQQDFVWPAKQEGTRSIGSTGSQNNRVPFIAGDGLWGVFKIFREAQRSGKRVTWTRASGGGPLEPPVQVDFVGDLPGGVDIFDPSFFSELRCPTSAVR